MTSESSSFKIKNLDKLLKQLEALPKDVLVSMERKVLRKCMNTLKESTEVKVPVRTGNLKKSFSIRVKADKSKGQLVGQLINNAYHAHLIEFGHLHVGHKPRKKIIGVVAARPFMRPAMEQMAQTLINNAVDGFNEALAKLGNKG